MNSPNSPDVAININMESKQSSPNQNANTFLNPRLINFNDILDWKNIRRRAKIFIALFIGMICYVILVTVQTSTNTFQLVGGTVGLLSCIIVLIAYPLNKDTCQPSIELLFWRSICDLGIAIRFLSANGFNLMVCGNSICTTQNNATDQVNCWAASSMFQFFEASSELWFLCNGLDMYFSISYPFSSFKSRMKYYHFFVWSLSAISTIPTLASPDVYGYWFVNNRFDQEAVCWIQFGNGYNIWVLFFIPLAVIYLTCVGIMIFAYYKLRLGISRTIIHRLQVLITNAINITILIFYWLILGLFYGGSYIAIKASNNIQGASFLYQLLLYMISAKGLSSLIVWFTVMDIDFNENDSTVKVKDATLDLNSALRQEILYYATAGIRMCARRSREITDYQHIMQIISNDNSEESNENLVNVLTVKFFIRLIFGMTREVKQIGEIVKNINKPFQPKVALEETPEVSSRLSILIRNRPTVNTLNTMSRLRQSIYGAPNDISMNNDMPNANSGISMTNMKTNSDNRRPSVLTTDDNDQSKFALINITEDPTLYEKLILDIKKLFGFGPVRPHVEFTEFEPFYFRKVRMDAGISDDNYIGAFKTTIKERLSEGGASGAFFFFSKGELFIAKSCTVEEVDNIKKNAAKYATYLESNKESYISKIYGAYRLTIYNTSLHFFVMNNIFLNREKAVIHEKYDIKGSWVARSSKPPLDGQRVTCTHCEQKFTYYRRSMNRRELSIKSSGKKITLGQYLFLTLFRGKKVVKEMKESADDTNNNTASESISLISEERCPYKVNGIHEPNIILKDNDLKYKIRLPMDKAAALLAQLRKDADFLYSIDVMDYSLLVGVHNTEYDVTETRSRSPSRASSNEEDEDSIGSIENPLHQTPISSNIRDSPVTGKSSKTKSLLKRSNTSSDLELSSNVSSESAASPYFSKRLLVSRVVGPESYYMGIIDYQQTWTFSKQMERFFKINIKGVNGNGLSAIEPTIYKDRFIRHMEDILDVDLSERTALLRRNTSVSVHSTTC